MGTPNLPDRELATELVELALLGCSWVHRGDRWLLFRNEHEFTPIASIADRPLGFFYAVVPSRDFHRTFKRLDRAQAAVARAILQPRANLAPHE